MSGGRPPKRPAHVLHEQRVYIAQRWNRGDTHTKIAHDLETKWPEYKTDRSWVSREMTKMLDEYREQYLSDIDSYLAKTLMHIDHLEAEAWDAWERSKQGRRRTEQEIDPGDMEAGTEARVIRATNRVDSNVGDPRYLDTVKWCIEQRMKLQGLGREREDQLGGGVNGQSVRFIIESTRSALQVIGDPRANAEHHAALAQLAHGTGGPGPREIEPSRFSVGDKQG